MPRALRSDGQADFRGGLNLAADPLQLAPNEVRRADEAVLTEYGGITKRRGSQKLTNSALSSNNSIQNGFAWLKDDGTQQLLAVANGTLYTASYAIGTTWTAQSGALAASGAPGFAAFRDGSGEVVYIADGAAPLNKWNGTTLNTSGLTGTPAVTQLAVYNQRLFGVTGTNQTLHWSAINNGDSLGVAAGGGGSAVIRTFSDQTVTAIAALRSSLLIFHTSGISRFTGLTQDDIVISAGTLGVTSDVGTIAPRSVVATEQGVFFLSDRGFFVASESDVRPISVRLDPLIRSLNLAQSSGVIGAHARATKEILWYLPAVGIVRYSYALDAWTGPCAAGYVTPATTSLWEAQDADRQPIVLAGDAWVVSGSLGGVVKRVDAPAVYRDNVAVNGSGGTAYTFAVECRRFFAGDPSSVKSFKWAYLMTNLRGASTAGISWSSVTGGGTATITNTASAGVWGFGTWGTGTWGGISTQPLRVPISGQGQYLDLTITDSSAADSLWSRVELEAFDYGRRY